LSETPASLAKTDAEKAAEFQRFLNERARKIPVNKGGHILAAQIPISSMPAGFADMSSEQLAAMIDQMPDPLSDAVTEDSQAAAILQLSMEETPVGDIPVPPNKDLLENSLHIVSTENSSVISNSADEQQAVTTEPPVDPLAISLEEMRSGRLKTPEAKEQEILTLSSDDDAENDPDEPRERSPSLADQLRQSHADDRSLEPICEYS
jgi:hypothetical protein